jgi:hypothetical protein
LTRDDIGSAFIELQEQCVIHCISKFIKDDQQCLITDQALHLLKELPPGAKAE